MVVDLTIEHEPGRLVLARHGLVSAGHVHDGEPAVAEAHAVSDPAAFIVGTAVTQQVAHCLEARAVDARPRVDRDDPYDSAHGQGRAEPASPVTEGGEQTPLHHTRRRWSAYARDHLYRRHRADPLRAHGRRVKVNARVAHD